MKHFLITAAALLCVTSPAQVVLNDPQHGASMAYDRKEVDGGIKEFVRITDGLATRVTESVFGAGGVLSHKTFSLSRRDVVTKTEVGITAEGAALTTTNSNGASLGSKIPLVKRGDVHDPSSSWFVSGKPTVGASATFMSFEPEHRYWEEVTVTYTGRGKIANSPEGNIVVRKSARKTITIVFDDKGLPLVWQEGRLTLIRAKS